MDRTYHATEEDLEFARRYIKSVDVKYMMEPSMIERWQKANDLTEEINNKAKELQETIGSAGFKVAPRTRLCETQTEVIDGPAKIKADELDEEFVIPLLTELAVERASSGVWSDVYDKTLLAVSEAQVAAAAKQVRISLADLRSTPKANRASIRARMRSAGLLVSASPWPDRPATSSCVARRGPCKWGEVPLYRCYSAEGRSRRSMDLEERFNEIVEGEA
ncbi:hypothetical protein FOL47_009366 [Perkinsus chesapeaki]|uniref:Uncharacterized protein n=1 Tax=Perkinsus chesapeaki TaxID=330153 RepID=A0A7J6MS47_PERCH|nr:hypothetical protein FOL47_009366 [Perkinsus chesapeaki]